MSGLSLFQRSTVSCMPGTQEVNVSVTFLPAGLHEEEEASEDPPPSESLPPHPAAVSSNAAETSAAAAPVRRLRAVRIWLSFPSGRKGRCDVEMGVTRGWRPVLRLLCDCCHSGWPR